MPVNTLRTFVLTTMLVLGNLGSARAEPIPAPTAVLRDFHGLGVIVIDLPADARPAGSSSEKSVRLGLGTWIDIRQAYVQPDRILVELGLQSTRQTTVVMAGVERTYSPATQYIVQREFRNLPPGSSNPIPAIQMSMASYASVLRELDTGKLLPDEDMDRIIESHKQRMAVLAALRKELAQSRNIQEIQRVDEAALEQARLRDDLEQIKFRREHPCHVVEFDNRDLGRTLLARGLVGSAGTESIDKGRTRFWITKAEGLPIRMETTDNNGRVAIHFIFTMLKINAGLRSSDLVLNAPEGTRLISTVVDLKDRAWEKKMEEDLTAKISRFEEERLKRAKANAPATKPRRSGTP
jgi:hypothetical protein